MERVEKDYEEFLRLLNKHKVKYCIVGGFAVGFHAFPRYTKDIDILVEPTLVNGRKICDVLKEFGFSSLNLTAEDFSLPKQIIQLGYEPVRIDLITSVKGCSFQEIWKNKVIANYGNTKVYFAGLKKLIKIKNKTGRSQDRSDIEKLSFAFDKIRKERKGR
ncbi:MAG: hypothetical protein A3I11_05470 [Elusimicrobia bacterium RIFCSPLOWO2_02_FULL_39_32]|nr:MAG: hypothetical protein A2034_02575 [Elusimicrobia bacterium GWA2_38_7]OGR80010.1 MAG: hypothetical protein A3B80_00135 [Elusimicrobia bacterium RIFCSPHIGHO2_02_FULL_39_36]OGR91195.1 MAG: hypothetical protein A3I11_05470 [Elusimicrobia bacterium RIFCSPLOWO2_02_FULL_39_32]OGS00163.1 MAG: hypothetical protein A3G85_08435 [Elusimicrobia bacterium RIFCSPLOWO2_12_FULL_39_28]